MMCSTVLVDSTVASVRISDKKFAACWTVAGHTFFIYSMQSGLEVYVNGFNGCTEK
jgi:hypothetical protein